MSKIHYFQRYSSYENTVTNNTLQLIARIYSHSNDKASQLLSELTGESIDIGIEINQQTHGEASIPDGTILQRSFKIQIESKVESGVDVDQLIRHSKSFAKEDQIQILILLTVQDIGSLEKEIQHAILKSNSNVIFKSVTYEQICQSVDQLIEHTEYSIRPIIDDYIEYCNEAGLFDQSRHLMRIVPCGVSFDLNKKYGMYFQPSDRGYTNHRYLGVYKEKAVRVIWEIDSVFDISYIDGVLRKDLIQGRSTDDYDEKIVHMIQDAKTECGYAVETGSRFFCGSPVETNYIKNSSGGIQGARFVNVHAEVDEFEGIEELAAKLATMSWS